MDKADLELKKVSEKKCDGLSAETAPESGQETSPRGVRMATTIGASISVLQKFIIIDKGY